MRKKILKLTLKLIIPIIFIVFLFQLELKDVWQTLSELNLFFLIIAIVFGIIMTIIKSERWRSLIQIYQSLSFYKVFRATIHGNFYGSLTRARIGEGLKAPMIKNENITYSQIIFTIIIDRLYDVITILLAGFWGLIWLRDIVKVNNSTILIISAIIVAIAIVLYYALKKLREKCNSKKNCDKTRAQKNIIKKTSYLIIDIINQVIKNPKSFKKPFAKALFYNLAAFVFFFLTFYFVTLSLNINMSFTFAVLCYSVVSLLGILPITISGIGTRDAALIFFFAILGIVAEKAIAVSLIDLVIMNYGIFLVLFIALFLFKPNKFSNKI